ncbi:MAG: nitroreductase family deazaflavin-dependent oxidoreductase [Asgard group archaeon]|nr:nitroreductase family deazaflavin-dependent oxidoreductase [Asgard group archaeon]
MSEKFKLNEKSIVARHQKGNVRFRKFTKQLNRIFSFLYRINLLPLFGVGRTMILLKTIGRKTGKKRTTPVLCRIFHTGELTLYSARGKKADWLRNILADEKKQTNIQKGFRRMKVEAKLVEPVEEREEHLKYWFENLDDAKYIFGYERDKHGDVTATEEFKKIAKSIEFIQLIPVK